MLEFVTGCNFSIFMPFADTGEGGGGEGGKQSERCLSARAARTAPTLIPFPSVSNHHLIIFFMKQMITHNIVFPTTAAAQKDRLDGAGAPGDVRQFGKGAALLREKVFREQNKN